MSSEPNTIDNKSLTREYPQSPIAVAHAIVLKDDRVLLIKRAKEPSLRRWSVPGGMIELGETVYDAVKREVREECGIEIEVREVVNVVDNIIPDERGHIRFHYVVIYLVARYIRGDAQPNSDASETCWIRQRELDSLDMNPAARRTVQQAFDMAEF